MTVVSTLLDLPTRHTLDNIYFVVYVQIYALALTFHVAFVEEFQNSPQSVQDEIAAKAELLAAIGPTLKRPYADTLKGSRFANMKELRFDAEDGVWRLGYAFGPERRAILLVAVDKW